MDRIDHQKYIYVHYHLKLLLREWNKLKPSFEAKLTKAFRTNPYAKYILCLRVWQFSVRIYDANLELYRLLNHIVYSCNPNNIRTRSKLFHKSNMGFPLYNFANKVINETILLQKKFEAVYTLPKKETDYLPFKNFPYEFQSRLVALLPPSDCVSFKLAGKTATKCVKTRGQFSAFLLVVRNSGGYKNLRTDCFKNPGYDITSTNIFLKTDNWFIKNGLYLTLNSTESFNRAVETVSGTYHSLQLAGPYTWKHAIHFMNLSNSIRDVILYDGMLLDVEDFHDFFEAIVQCFKHQKTATVILIECPDLVAAFGNQLQEYVGNQTNIKVVSIGGTTVIFEPSILKLVIHS